MKTDSPTMALIAEDNPLVARAIANVVRELGFDVTIVNNGEAARRFVFAERPDLLIADIGLPNVGGSALIRWLKAIRPDARVVAISGMGDAARDMALMAGADAFLAKPFRLSELKRVIRDTPPGGTDVRQ